MMRYSCASSNRTGQASMLVFVFIIVLAVLLLHIGTFPAGDLIKVFVALTVFVLAFLKTDFAIIILIFSMLLSPEIAIGRVSDRAVTLRFDDIFLFVIFLGWLAKLAIFKELGLLKKTPLNGPIFVYILVCLLST